MEWNATVQFVATRPQKANEKIPLKTSSIGIKAAALLIDGSCGTGCTSQSTQVSKLVLQAVVRLEDYNCRPATQQSNQRFSFTPMGRNIEEDETLAHLHMLSNLLIMEVVP